MINLTKSVGLNLHKRSSAEIRFQSLGIISILVSLGFLAWLLITIFAGSLGAAKHVEINIPVNLSADKVDPNNIRDASFGSIIKSGLRSRFPDVKNRKDKKKLYNLISSESTFELRDIILKDPGILGGEQNIWVSASDDLSLFFRGKMNVEVPEDQRQISDKEINWIEKLNKEGQIRSKVNWGFFKNGDSREPEIAGILAALVGSALSLSVCFVLSFPLGVAAATYLEQFAPRSRISDIIEVNINNLAAVPSIVFGLLGLSIFLGYFDLPRSSPLVGGMVLSLMTLPTIIIASRASLQSVPPSIKEAALALGATPVQAVFHHVFPVALPGMLTGAIVGMARALGDTAPLLMIGMVAFIVDVPNSILEPATALPVQVFLWADSPERAFSEKTSAAIIVLLIFLIIMNLVAVLMRRRLEQRF
ncbi:MAG: phosphate ABC transporter permease PstA [Rhodobacteraceae bacterium]|nr:MAG: phosphate ABC transporter permease PstA [Paracoccaceae bacterium]